MHFSRYTRVRGLHRISGSIYMVSFDFSSGHWKPLCKYLASYFFLVCINFSIAVLFQKSDSSGSHSVTAYVDSLVFTTLNQIVNKICIALNSDVKSHIYGRVNVLMCLCCIFEETVYGFSDDSLKTMEVQCMVFVVFYVYSTVCFICIALNALLKEMITICELNILLGRSSVLSSGESRGMRMELHLRGAVFCWLLSSSSATDMDSCLPSLQELGKTPLE